MGDVYVEKFSVDYEYQVHFTRDVFGRDNGILSEQMKGAVSPSRVAVYIDSGVVDSHPDILSRIESYCEQHAAKMKLVASPIIVPGGESCKNGWDGVRRIMTELGELRMCRQSYVIAIGGGSVLDMVGFAASLVHRGVRLIRIPTTVLAQNDAGVGVKNGMNEHGMKNFVGTFAPPCAVINDSEFLASLEDRDWCGGIAEAFKVAIIKDEAFLEFLCDSAVALHARDLALMEELVKRCAVLHLEHIGGNGDPFEFGSARPLDFGHWAAHRLEVMSEFAIGHGQAVSIGMAIDTYYAWKKGMISEDHLHMILKGLSEAGLPLWHTLLERRDRKGTMEVLSGIEDFREHLGGVLCVTLPNPVGNKVEVHEMDLELIDESVAFLADYVKEASDR